MHHRQELHHHSEEIESPIAPKTAEKGTISHALGGQLSASAESFMQRVLDYGKEHGQLTQLDEVQRLYREGNEEELDLYLHKLVDTALEHDEESLSNLQILKTSAGNVKLQEQRDAAIRLRQRELYEEYKATIVSLAGLPDSYGLDEQEIARDRIKSIVEKSAETNSTNDVLIALGILSIDEDGKEVFTYPAGLFPPRTDMNWKIYLQKVRVHLKVQADVKAGRAAKTEETNPDLLRKMTHDTVAKDIDELLGINDFEWTRRMVAKMRDTKYPTVETAERDKTTEKILHAANALGVLATKVSDTQKI